MDKGLAYLVNEAITWFKDTEEDSRLWRWGRLAVDNKLTLCASLMVERRIHYRKQVRSFK